MAKQIVLCVILAFVFAPPSEAFKTYKLFGGNIHEQISEQALAHGGFHLKKSALKQIDAGNTEQDDPFRAYMVDETHHFDNCKLDETKAYIEHCHKKIVELAPKALNDFATRKLILRTFGNLLHPIQDFYSHSNYLELKLKADKTRRHQSVPLVNWDDVANAKISSQVPSIRTGFFYYKSKVLNEVTMPRSKAITALTEKAQVPAGTTFLPTRQYKQLSNTDRRLDFACDPQRAFLHCDINKDNGSTDEGAVRTPLNDATLFDCARNLAMRETRVQWKQLESEIRASVPTKADQLILNLTNGD